jgi:hypothetical protein
VDEFLPSWYSMKTRIIKQRIVYWGRNSKP